MKRQAIAIVLGSLFALPAFANYELYGSGFAPQAPVSSKSRADVRAELAAAQRSGDWVINAELGTTARDAAPVQLAGKTREQVREELLAAQASGDWIVNAELGTKASHAAPAQVAGRTRAEVLAEVADTAANRL